MDYACPFQVGPLDFLSRWLVNLRPTCFHFRGTRPGTNRVQSYIFMELLLQPEFHEVEPVAVAHEGVDLGLDEGEVALLDLHEAGE